MTNYVLSHFHTLQLGVGLSCCPSPAAEPDLSVVWGRHRPALINLLLTLQGMHVAVENIGEGTPAVVRLHNREEVVVPRFGHLWRLLPDGHYTVSVSVDGFKNMTKVVSVTRESFTEVVFALPFREPRVPRFVAFTMVVTSAGVLFVLFLYCRCRDRQRKARKASYVSGFQLLGR